MHDIFGLDSVPSPKILCTSGFTCNWVWKQKASATLISIYDFGIRIRQISIWIVLSIKVCYNELSNWNNNKINKGRNFNFDNILTKTYFDPEI